MQTLGAKNVPQRGLCQQSRWVMGVFHVGYRHRGVGHAVVDHGIDWYSYRVFGQDLPMMTTAMSRMRCKTILAKYSLTSLTPLAWQMQWDVSDVSTYLVTCRTIRQLLLLFMQHAFLLGESDSSLWMAPLVVLCCSYLWTLAANSQAHVSSFFCKLGIWVQAQHSVATQGVTHR